MRLSGGCQCGAVRYEITETPDHASLCHCRMCQKAMGGAYLASATVRPGTFRWTRGTPASFQSSSVAGRLFCAACGTPLGFLDTTDDTFAVTLGSLDTPDAIKPNQQIGIESRLSWWRGDGLDDGRTTQQDLPELADSLRNHQHPDHDTETWPPPS